MKEMSDLYSIKDIIKEGRDGEYLAFCESGNAYYAKYNAKMRTMFFAIPDYEKITGYTKIIGRI